MRSMARPAAPTWKGGERRPRRAGEAPSLSGRETDILGNEDEDRIDRMSRILVCQHVAFEILGTLHPLLRSYGIRIKHVNFGRHPDAKPSLDGYRGLVVLGGPMSVDDVGRHPHLATEERLIRSAIEREIPVLGICLGAQLIAKALGAEVSRNPEKEIGWYDVSLTEAGRRDPLFAHFRETESIFHWHGDSFDLPEGAAHLASSSACPHQAFRYRDRVYALQFHLEVDERLIERWLGVPVHLAEIAELDGKVDPDAIRRETQERVGRLKQLSDRTFREFVLKLGATQQRPEHPHR
jgi:GMP synthase (glutamine-hydrolysing)